MVFQNVCILHNFFVFTNLHILYHIHALGIGAWCKREDGIDWFVYSDIAVNNAVDSDYLRIINTFPPVEIVRTYFFDNGKQIYEDLWDIVRNCGRYEIQKLKNIEFPKKYQNKFISWITEYGARIFDYKQYLIQLMRNKRNLKRFYGKEKSAQSVTATKQKTVAKRR